LGRIKDIFSAAYWSARSDLCVIGKGVSELQRKGWVENPIDAPKDEMARIRDALSQLPKEQWKLHERRSHDGYEEYDTGMLDIEDLGDVWPWIVEMDLVSDLMSSNREIVEQAAGKKVVREQLRAYVNVGITNTRRYHCDTYYDNLYKAFLYLTDVDELGHGPYLYIEGSNRPIIGRYLNIIKNAFCRYPIWDAHYYQEKSERKFLGEAGTAIVTDQRGYHRGHPQKPGAVRMVLVHVMWVW